MEVEDQEEKQAFQKIEENNLKDKEDQDENLAFPKIEDNNQKDKENQEEKKAFPKTEDNNLTDKGAVNIPTLSPIGEWFGKFKSKFMGKNDEQDFVGPIIAEPKESSSPTRQKPSFEMGGSMDKQLKLVSNALLGLTGVNPNTNKSTEPNLEFSPVKTEQQPDFDSFFQSLLEKDK